MKKVKQEIKKPQDLTGRCPKCSSYLALREGKGLCFCPVCKIEYEFYVKSSNNNKH